MENSLNIEKLYNFMCENGYEPQTYFSMDKLCFLILFLCTKTGESAFLYIPSKYEFPLEPNHKDIYKISYIEMNPEENNADEYAEEPDEQDVQEKYEFDVGLPENNEKIEEYLEKNYKKLPIKVIRKEDQAIVKSNYRQMRRIKYCVQDLPYKAGILYKSFFSLIRRDNRVDCFVIPSYSKTNSRQLFVVMDLETLYDKRDKAVEELQDVKRSLYTVLGKNQNSNVKLFEQMLENKADILSIPILAEQKKSYYEQLLKQNENLLNTINLAEDNVLNELELLRRKRINENGLHTDISNAHLESQLRKKLDDVQTKKTKISRISFALHEKLSNAILAIDNALFDNAVMFSTIINNLAKLKEVCGKNNL